MEPDINLKDFFHTIIDALPVCISYVDSKQRYRYNNSCYEKWFNIKDAGCYGKHMRDVIGPDAYRASKTNIEKVLKGEKVSFEARFHTRFGVAMETRVIFQPDFESNGKCKGFVVLATDISEEKKAVRALELSRQQFQQLFEETPAGLILFEVIEEVANPRQREFRFLMVNESWLRETGVRGEYVLGKTVAEAFPRIENYWYETMNRVHETGRPERIEEYFVELSRLFDVSFFKLQEGLLACSFIDSTDRKLAEQRTRKQHEQVRDSFGRVSKYLAANRKRQKREEDKREGCERQMVLSDSIFLHTFEGICITGADGKIEQVNPAFTAITGYSEEEVLGKNPRILRSNHHDKAFYKNMWDNLLNTGSWEGEIWNRRKNGEAYLEYLAITAVTDRKDQVLNYVAVFHDISELHSSKEQIAYYTSYDALTGLPNRTFFVNHCSKLITYADPHDETFAVALLDLDNFRDVNEAMGYEVGDRILKRVASRIGRCCRNQDTVARLGGDGFAILVPESGRSIDEILLILERVMETVAKPFSIGGSQVFLKASIGVSVFPDHGNKSQTLLQKAEMALYQAKELGGSRVKIFTESAQEEVRRRLALKSSLRLALDREEFELYYQPKVNLKDDTINGVEALIRWHRQDGQLIPPDEFIPLAEESELITEIGAWVIEEASRQLNIWHKQGLTHFTVAINLSARQFVDLDLLDRLHGAIDRHGLNVRDLQLEITEHTMVEQIDQTVAIMESITEHGFAISIDDFGTGFSSLAYLKQFPITTLKIDRTFVKNLPDDKHDKTIISLTLSLARSLGMAVVAEGVETQEQLEFLRELGCDEYQGYLCSRPLPAQELEKFLLHRVAV
jgi:diguanylate cyclase (GGDEF)-like protein/PAS domain S-box-containing protein